MNDVAKRLISLESEILGLFPREKIDFFLDEIKNGEVELAYEVLCDWFTDYNIKNIPVKLYKEIKEIGEALYREEKISGELWSDLEQNVQTY